MQLEDGNAVMFFTLFIDLRTAVPRSEGFKYVSQIPVKPTLLYSMIWLFIVTLFPPAGLNMTHDTSIF